VMPDAMAMKDAASRVSTRLGTEPWKTCIASAVVASLRPDKNQ
jgi:hypothetical protein